ncbi:MAG TPA: alpha-galactosidase [Marmoricola sp.]|nr:alpha-galactosidase [Marmoricola sp.]
MTDRPVHLSGGGVSILLAPSPLGVPTLLHWGADVGAPTMDDLAAYLELRRPGVPHSALDLPRHLSVLPDNGSGFTGTPAVEGRRPEPDPTRPWAPRFLSWSWETDDDSAVLTSADDEAGLAVRWELGVTEEGLVRVRSTLTNNGPTSYAVDALRATLPVPAEATELLDLTGRWTRERTPQRHPWPQGTWTRSGRHGRTGHDATLLLVAGTPGFGFRRGSVWGIHVGWSGDHESYAERTPEGECLLGGGELLGPGEVVLDPGESYAAPWLVGSFADAGLDGMADRLHRWTRRHSPRSRRTRPVVVNTWEAVYFDHDLDRLSALADVAAEVGAERFVLDDGWFRGRRHDRAGLGDWTVDPEVWPAGLGPLVDHVRSRGMEFGLWVEPEMVNEDSDLARDHPEWLLRGRGARRDSWRFQQVLDLQHPDAYDHVRSALLALLEEHDIAFLKWDHNRDLVDVAHGGRPAVHGQTLAFYRLLDELRESHPSIEIESCASGGGRIDLGVLGRTDRVWPSDTMDPLLRVGIQRWTTLLVPPELVGAHVGGPVAHTTGRVSPLGFRAAVALLNHFGIEWDLTRASPGERAEVARWVALHKQLRHLVAEGTMVRPDHPDPAVTVTGMVAQDRTEAVYVVAVTDSPATQTPAVVLLEGLAEELRYRVEPVRPSETAHVAHLDTPWTAGGPVVTSGALLARVGVRLPPTSPESAYVLVVSCVDGEGRQR